ncbi:MAG: putative sugar transporter, permease protein [Herbinix sp.]|jgi:arabinogalactan oligomer/maltooligosaccharide transport system permease protein|nr:putative sugar transporter, permease protein [Herbinix sp.]
MSKKKKERIQLSVVHIILILVCFISMVPILYALSVSLSAQNSLLSKEFSFLPKALTLKNYRAVLFEEPVLLWLKNSLLLAVSTVVLSLTFAIPSAYAFSRFRFPGKKTILYLLLILNAFPSILSMLAIYKLISTMGLMDSKLGLIIIYTGTMCIFGLWNLKGYFDTIPNEIEEAGKMDGATDLQLVMRIILPLARPSIIVVMVMILIFVWNEYIFAITFMTGTENYTLAGGLYSLQATEMSGNWPIFSAASLLISLPILIIFFKFQKYMVSGLTVGGVKG